MDEPFRDSMALADILCQNRRAVFCCGHLHRSLCTDFGGVRGVVCPSLALNMELDFGPGGGNSFTVAAPAYALHRLEGGTITSHFCQVPGSWPYLGPFEF
jgi:hypothetical protein